MTTAQILILVILAIIYFIGVALMYFSDKFGIKSAGLSLVSFSVSILIATILALTSRINKHKDPCPKYEKIDNVYKLKE